MDGFYTDEVDSDSYLEAQDYDGETSVPDTYETYWTRVYRLVAPGESRVIDAHEAFDILMHNGIHHGAIRVDNVPGEKAIPGQVITQIRTNCDSVDNWENILVIESPK